jgi:hypothetical protein
MLLAAAITTTSFVLQLRVQEAALALALQSVPPMSARLRHRYDAAIVLTIMNFVDFDPLEESIRRQQTVKDPLPGWVERGFGSRFTVSFSRALSAEFEIRTLRRYLNYSGPELRGGAKSTLVGAIQFSVPCERFRFGGRIGPGILFERARRIVAISAGTDGTEVVELESHSAEPVLNIGATASMHLTSRMSLRTDIGADVIRYAPSPRGINPTFVRHNPSFAVSLGFGFGPRVH